MPGLFLSYVLQNGTVEKRTPVVVPGYLWSHHAFMLEFMNETKNENKQSIKFE